MAIDLLDNLIPATLDIYAILFRSGSSEQYVETVFRIWTFALRWKRKNYNKAPLVFLSDLFYWQDNHHPFADAVKKYLPCFNDYYVENTHSRIRANTSSNATAENIIKQAYVIDIYALTYYIEINKLFLTLYILSKLGRLPVERTKVLSQYHSSRRSDFGVSGGSRLFIPR